jgi:hypothetical protein
MKRMKKILNRLTGYIRSLTKVGKKLVPTDTKLMLSRIAEEGYETACDILFPKQETKQEKLHYGPVLPG